MSVKVFSFSFEQFCLIYWLSKLEKMFKRRFFFCFFFLFPHLKLDKLSGLQYILRSLTWGRFLWDIYIYISYIYIYVYIISFYLVFACGCFFCVLSPSGSCGGSPLHTERISPPPALLIDKIFGFLNYCNVSLNVTVYFSI